MSRDHRRRIAISISSKDHDLLLRARYLSQATGMSIAALAKVGLEVITSDPSLIPKG